MTEQELFDLSFEDVIGHEGGYQRMKEDRGNWTGGKVGKGVLKGTKYGVSAASYPDLDIKNLTTDEAKAIYKKDYWDKLRMGDIPDLIKRLMFDTAVHHGVRSCIRILQRACHSTPDGIMGPNTRGAVAKWGDKELGDKFLDERLKVLKSGKSWDLYSKGFTNRINRERKVVEEW